MGALPPSPEDAKNQEDGADGLANPTHSPKPNLRCPRRAPWPLRGSLWMTCG